MIATDTFCGASSLASVSASGAGGALLDRQKRRVLTCSRAPALVACTSSQLSAEINDATALVFSGASSGQAALDAENRRRPLSDQRVARSPVHCCSGIGRPIPSATIVSDRI